MDPETLTSKDLLAVIAQHESSFQRHEAVLSHQEELMTKHSQLLSDVMGSIRQLFERLPGASSPSASPPSSNRPTQLQSLDYHLPNPLLGILNPARVFLPMLPDLWAPALKFSTDRSKIAYIITLLSDKALSWASAVWQSRMLVVSHMRPLKRSSSECLIIQSVVGKLPSACLHSVKASAALQISPLSFGPSRQEADGTIRRWWSVFREGCPSPFKMS